MKTNWRISTNNDSDTSKRIFPELEKITEDILTQRGIDTKEKKEEFLYPDYEKHLHNPKLLTDIQKAVNRILQARKNKETIYIYGDYDVDGITSATILSDFLNQIGLKSKTYLPDRNKEGYGLNQSAIDYIKKQGTDLIITVDCGITNFDEVEYAKQQNLDVIITDHHFVPEKIPKALAVINPKRKKDKYPEKMLAGVGVTFKLIQAIADEISDYDNQQLKWLLDLVAIGNVADCVPLLGENRTLTKYGLMVLSKTRRVGLKQLFTVGRINIDASRLPGGEVIGFQIAPRINAAGRMNHASLAYELLTRTPDKITEARTLALEIESQNQRRQKETLEIMKEVEKELDIHNLPTIIIQSSKHWSLGLVGLVAGRIADKYNRPCILLQEKDGELKGSCRSIPAFHLMEALPKVSKLLKKFGGHSQAAGITLTKKNFPKFKKSMIELAKKQNIHLAPKEITIDLKISLKEINEKLLDELLLMEPFGQGNPKPKFLSRNVVVKRIAYLGTEQKHLKIWLADKEEDSEQLEIIAFFFENTFDFLTVPNKVSDKKTALKPGDKIDIIYTLEENIWNGQRSIQGKIVDIKILSSPKITP